jgi:K+/H+ antiporter YhaU regulatory subunit KhtT
VEDTGDRELHQVVVREGSSFIGEALPDSPFRQRFGAALTDLRRDGDRLAPLSPTWSFVRATCC